MKIGNLNVTEDALTDEMLISHINIEIAMEIFHMLTELKRKIEIMNMEVNTIILEHNIEVVNDFIEKYYDNPFMNFNGNKICLN